MIKKIFLFLFYTFFYSYIVVGAEYRIDVFNPLQQTPSAIIPDNLTKPNIFNKNNNLNRATGSFKVAVGEPLYIEGKILDSFKIPIEGVIVKIWQTNAAGYYQSLLNKNSDFYDPNFIGSGQSISDNAGNYSFLTIFPGFYKDRAPHINMIVSHKKFGIIETEIYFYNHPHNKNDPIYLIYSEDEKKTLTAEVNYVDAYDIKKGKIITFNIVMDGIHQYKRY